MTATEAAEKMMAERGYVVLGYKPEGKQPFVGETTRHFAGGPVKNGRLRLVEQASRYHWDEQLKLIFGNTSMNQKLNKWLTRASFWKAVLERE